MLSCQYYCLHYSSFEIYFIKNRLFWSVYERLFRLWKGIFESNTTQITPCQGFGEVRIRKNSYDPKYGIQFCSQWVSILVGSIPFLFHSLHLYFHYPSVNLFVVAFFCISKNFSLLHSEELKRNIWSRQVFEASFKSSEWLF